MNKEVVKGVLTNKIITVKYYSSDFEIYDVNIKSNPLFNSFGVEYAIYGKIKLKKGIGYNIAISNLIKLDISNLNVNDSNVFIVNSNYIMTNEKFEGSLSKVVMLGKNIFTTLDKCQSLKIIGFENEYIPNEIPLQHDFNLMNNDITYTIFKNNLQFRMITHVDQRIVKENVNNYLSEILRTDSGVFIL